MDINRTLTYCFIYLMFVFTFFQIWEPVFTEYSRQKDKATEEMYALVPDISLVQLQDNLSEIRCLLDNGVGSRPEAKFETLFLIEKSEQSIAKMTWQARTKGYSFEKLQYYQEVLSHYRYEFSSLQKYYQAEFGVDKMMSAGKDYLTRTDGGVKKYPVIDYSTVQPLFLQAYVHTIVPAMLFFMLRLYQKGLSVALELWRVMLWSLIWFVGVWKYPRNILRAEQLRSMCRFVGGLISVLVSILPMSSLVKAADKKR
ncbi:MAG: hypothetical protein H6779_04960 [Candidatus Nomurabacteria bacterium]|nr:hypothetical protein [Candidatus Nomurabacteria bacterium]USN87718.1 MAG: hypothetical protein H6779_04960 [Candidatus Nomurabacteria bacterium]